MFIDVSKNDMEKDRFNVWITDQELSYNVMNGSVFISLNAEQLDKLCFQGQAALQESERLSLDKS